MPETPGLPAHVEQTIEAIADLKREHRRRATPSQKAVAQLTAFVGRPRFFGYSTVVIGIWIGLNTFLKLTGHDAPDPPPFSYAQDVAGVAGVYITILILITQRHENQLSEARDQLTLELAILNEQKSAKIIALLEEMRRDNPVIPDRVDEEAEQLAQAADPRAVLDAIRSTTADGIDLVDEAEVAADPDA